MSRPGRLWTKTNVRRAVQLASLSLFVWLFVQTRLDPAAAPGPLVKLFFLIDPLILIATGLAAHALPLAGLAALGVLGLTVLIGRGFCGWVCPFGALHAGVGWLLERSGRRRRQVEHTSPWQRAKYYVLAGFLAMALLGGHAVCILDPLVLLYRSITTGVLPAAQWAVEEVSTAVYRADPALGPAHLTAVTEPVYGLLRDHVFGAPKQAFLGGGVILAAFLGLLLLNAVRPRFWCRYLCPLGAWLGVFAWRPGLRRTVDASTCNRCELCNRVCPAASARGAGREWVAAECFVCLNCTAACPQGSLAFAPAVPLGGQPAAGLDLSRRSLLASAAGGVAGLCLLRVSPQARGTRLEPTLIRPPGARAERDFLQRCTACGLCMKVCPTGGLQPTWSEAGLEGLWTPRLVPRCGSCDYTCNLCGQVCPTQAIAPLSVAQKQGVKIGLAAFDTTRCIPHAFGRDCMVCEEHCPIPDKAIVFREVEAVGRDGQKHTVKQPYVDPDLCIGCGQCETVCPLRDRPGVYVTCANESRDPDNQPLPAAGGGGGSPY